MRGVITSVLTPFVIFFVALGLLSPVINYYVINTTVTEWKPNCSNNNNNIYNFQY
jgi:hypothetical protein